jgi:hypothetical protein
MSYAITDLITENKEATVAVAKHQLVVDDAAVDHGVALGVDGSVPVIGVTRCSAGVGERIDVLTMGVFPVKLGAAVTAGDPITADANGEGAVAAAGDYAVGFAITSGVVGEIIPVRVQTQRV